VADNNLNPNGKMAFDRPNAFIAGLVFIITLVVYVKTMAPTFSFWDCGEFVACSHILGIPHPPGSPLYVIIGRIYSILPFFSDISERVNFFSASASAVSAVLGYLVTVRLIQYWFKDQTNLQNRIITYIGGFTGALFMAFSSTNWSNSVEAEVYASAIMIMMAIYWLVLKYFDNRETTPGTKFMIAAAYLATLGVGIHLTLFVIIPVLGLYFILKKESGTKEWAVVSFFFFIELFLVFLLSARPGEIPYYLPVLILFLIFLFHSILLEKLTRPVLITVILYLVAVWPIYFIAVEALSQSLTGFGLSDSMQTMKQLPLGWVGFFGLVIWGIVALIKYLTSENKEEATRIWLIPSVYSLAPAVLYGVGLAFAQSGYTMFIILTSIVLAIMALLLWSRINWLILVAFGSISMIIFGFWQFTYGIAIGGAAILIIGLLLKDRNWKVAFAILLLAVIGYSVHVYIPIRSAKNPSIDENDPSRSFAALVNYLERKQYGSQSMTSRMFERRAEWKNQFGDFQRMGFWRFFKDQYGLRGPRFFIVLILGLFGIWETIRRKPEIGLPFFVLILVCTVGFVLYMNFADGTRINQITGMDYLEVRDRDYFFTPAFVMFGLAIGMGISGFIDLVRDTVKQYSSAIRNTAFGVSSLLVLLPLFPLANNYFYNDRSRNYMPFDYANNYLKCCDENTIFVTNGDNDTFPIWCIQEVYGIRKDVQVVNLSLANADWYTKQLRDHHGLKVGMTDEQINALRPYLLAEGEPYRIQSQVVDHIITANDWERPIAYAVTVPDENRRFRGRSLEDHLILRGMLRVLTTTEGKNQVDYDFTRRMFEDEFEYRGIADPTVYKDETSRRLSNNYAQGFLVLADSLKRAGDLDGALEHIRKGLAVIPESYDLYLYTAQLLGHFGKMDTLQAFIENAPIGQKDRLYYNWGVSARLAGLNDDAINVLELTNRLYPNYSDAFQALVRIYYQEKYYSRLRTLVTDWVARHPDDYESKELLRQIQGINSEKDTLEGRR